MGFFKKTLGYGTAATAAVGAYGGFNALYNANNAVAATHATAAAGAGNHIFFSGAAHALGTVGHAIGSAVVSIPGVGPAIGSFGHLGFVAAAHIGLSAGVAAVASFALPVVAAGVALFAVKKVWDHFRHKNDVYNPPEHVINEQQQAGPSPGRDRGMDPFAISPGATPRGAPQPAVGGRY